MPPYQKFSSRLATFRMATRYGNMTKPAWQIELWNRQLWNLALPTSLERIFSKIQWMLTLHVLGYHTSSVELASAALAATLGNVMGISIIVGMCFGMATLVGQASKHTDSIQLSIQQDSVPEIQLDEASQLTLASNNENEHESGRLLSNSITGHNLHINYGLTPTYKQPRPPTRHTVLLVYLYRGIFVHLAYTVPMGIVWMMPGLVSHMLEVYGGQDRTVAELTERYLQIIAPGIWMYTIHLTLATWLQALDLAHIPPLITLTAVILHPMLLYTLVPRLGYDGAPYAACFFLTIQPLILIFYLTCTQKGRKAVHDKLCVIKDCNNKSIDVPIEDEDLTIRRANLSSTRWLTNSLRNQMTGPGRIRRHLRFMGQAVGSWAGISQYLSLSLPGVVLVSEWWASEVCIFLSGHLIYEGDDNDVAAHAVPLAAMSIYQSLNTFCFSISQGFGVAASTRVGNELGAGNIVAAQLSALVATASSMVGGLILCILLLEIPHTLLPSWYDPNPLVYQTCAKTVPWLAFYVIGDGLAVTLTGIIKGCGRQQVVAPIVVFAYWILGVPLACLLTFSQSFLFSNDYTIPIGVFLSHKRQAMYGGVTGLVAGLTFATWVHMALLGLVVWHTDWHQERRKAALRINKESLR